MAGGVLSRTIAALLWPLGVRRRRQRSVPQDPSGEGEPPLEEDVWELDLAHCVGTTSGVLLAWWLLGRRSSGTGVLADAPATKTVIAAALPRVALSDFLRLLHIGAVTAVTYVADKPPAGALLLTASLSPAALAVVPALLAGKASRDSAVVVGETLLMPGCEASVFEELRQCKGLRFECAECSASEPSLNGLSLLFDVGGLVISAAALWYIFRGTGGTSGGSFAGKHLEDAAAAGSERQRPKVTFDDVAGMEGTKEELREVIAFLRNPGSFYALGARPPRGLLLAGPSGTGKTLLARAVAGEAGVPFLYASSAAFVEVFVGQGALRIRQFFENARACAPCIVFLDELDAVGAARQMTHGGNQEYCQTLNQLLLELDGVECHSSGAGSPPLVVTIAATNRYDILDEALVRPGRLDRIVIVSLPGIKERAATLQIHARRLRTEGLDFETLAQRTEGRSGADLANLLNEAALLAARSGATAVGMEHVAIVMSKRRPEQKSPREPAQSPWWGDDSTEGLAQASRAMVGMFAAAAAMAGGGVGPPQPPRATEVDPLD